MHRGCAYGTCLCQDILGEMEATAIATQTSAVGRVSVEHYFEEVLEGARSIEAKCSKNIMF